MRCVTGKAEMADSALSLLFQKIVHVAVFRIPVVAEGALIHIMQEVKIKIIHPAFFQLIFKNFLRVKGRYARDILMAGEFIRQIPALSGIAGERFTDGDFRLAAVIGIGRVKIVDAGSNGRVHHPVQLGLINFSRFVGGQAHRAKAECGKLQILKRMSEHMIPPVVFLYHSICAFPVQVTK